MEQILIFTVKLHALRAETPAAIKVRLCKTGPQGLILSAGGRRRK
jgi:hypothetical protein